MDLHQAVNSIDDGFLVSGEDLTVMYANDKLYRIFNLPAAGLLQQPLHTVLFSITQSDLKAQLQTCFQEQQKLVIEFQFESTGTWYYAEIFPFDKGLTVRLRDVTPFKEAHEEVLKSRRLYAFISEVNELILRAKTADEIFTSLCLIAVAEGNFVMAWTGKPDTASGKVIPIASAGAGTDYLTSIQAISIADVPTGRGPTGTSIRTGKPVFCNDIEKDPMMDIWREEALKRNFRSSISLPLVINGVSVALFTLYASVPHFFAEEEITLLVQVSKNISYALQSLQNEIRRQEAEEQLRKVSRAVEQASSSIVITDVNGTIEYVNPAFCQLTGYAAAEAIGQNPRILKTDYKRADEYKQLWEEIQHFKTWQGEFCNRTKHGEIYWESATISPIINEQGAITHYVAIKENITEKKKLEASQQALVNIIENTTAYVAIGNLDFNITYANQATKDVLGITEEELAQGVNIDTFIADSIPQSARDALALQLQQEGKWAGEFCFQSHSGTEVFVWMVAIIHRHADGTPSHYSATAVDITRVKDTEHQLRQLTIELRELSLHLQHLSEIEKKEIAREIHDEMGQQLTALKFDAKWLKRHMEDVPKEIDERLDTLIENVNELSSAFRRIHSSLHPNILEDLGLQGSLEWLISNFSHKANLNVQFECLLDKRIFPSDINLIVYRVAQESLSNISRYAQATRVRFHMMIENNRIKLSITDNGIGFDLNHIDTRLHHGLLGMRERLNAVNGLLTIETAPGTGTSIHAEIPLIIPAVQADLTIPLQQ